jgi:Asp-tRNA(Asn)/Glu-tRNA(Gln) amidotransferase A subunit family amidase
VQALLDAGALCLGKVALDQFAAGLNGTRAPAGPPPNALDSRVIPGGSSSGSATAVATGVVTFAVGTDTAGSGHVPAGLQALVGVKPSVGMISTRGALCSTRCAWGAGDRTSCEADPQRPHSRCKPSLSLVAISSMQVRYLCHPRDRLPSASASRAGMVPACASLDCLSVFARTVSEGALAAAVMVRVSRFPADPTLAFQPTLDAAMWTQEKIPVREAFKVAVPAESLMAYEGPRGAAYAAHCKAAFASCVSRCARCGPGQRATALQSSACQHTCALTVA